MAKNRSELIVQALNNLGLPGSGQAVSAEDAETMGGYVDAIVEMTNERGIAEIDSSEIPLAWFLPLSWMVSSAAANMAGAANDPRVILLGQNGEKLLRELNAARVTGLPARPEYF